MPKNHSFNRKEIGKIGENIVERFLVKHGFFVIQRNYRVKRGEIDLIASKSSKLCFFEVKTLQIEPKIDVSHETVTRETLYSATEVVDRRKRAKIRTAVRIFLANFAENNVSQETSIEFFVAAVALELNSMRYRIYFVADVL